MCVHLQPPDNYQLVCPGGYISSCRDQRENHDGIQLNHIGKLFTPKQTEIQNFERD